MDLKPGDLFAGLRIEGVAGKGGMGVVYRAVQPALDRLVALKTIAPALAADPAFAARFVRESKAAAAVEHPNVLPVFSAGEEDGVLYIVMRYVDGPDLRSLLRELGRLEPARAATIVAQIAAALDAAHARGLVHRDVKPANILLDRAEHAYLTDFGLTKRLHSDATAATRPGGWVGTLGYVAPEQIRDGRIDGRTDVYALGCVLFHALTGAPPYDRSSDEATLWAHLNDEPPALPPAVPGELGVVIGRALAKDPDDRYATAGELGRAVLAAVGRPAHSVAGLDVASGGVSDETRVTPPERRPDAPAGETAATTPAEGQTAPTTPAVPGVLPRGDTPPTEHAGGGDTPAPASPSRRRPALIAAAVAVVAVLGVAVALAASGGDEEGGSEQARTAATATTAVVEEKPAGVAVGDRPNGLAIARGSAYVTLPRSARLARVRLDDFTKVEEGPEVGRGALDVDAGFGALWASSASRSERLARVDLASGKTTYTDLPDGTPVAVEAGEGAVWVGVRGAKLRSYPRSRVVRVDPRTGKIVKSVEIPLGVQDITVGYGAVWVSNRARDSVTRLDIASGALDVIDVGAGPAGLAVGGRRVWVANAEDDTVSRISRSERRETGTIAVDREPRFLAYGAGSLWATTFTTSTLVRIDPAQPRSPAGDPVQLGLNPTKLVVSGDAVYAVSQGDGILERVPLSSAGG